LHSQAALLRHAHDVASTFSLTSPGSAILLNLPFVGIFGFCQFTAAFVAGATIVTFPIFNAEESMRALASRGITHIGGSDVMVDRFLAYAEGPRRFEKVRFCAYAAFSPSLDDIGARADARGLTLTAVYGSSEMQALFARQPESAPLEERIEKGGMPVSVDARVRVRDVESGRLLPHGETGELELTGPSRMIGYFGNLEATAKALTDDGYYRTGDLGFTRPDGRFVYLTRLDDGLRLGGILVSPAEIEAVVQEHPSVMECQIVAVQAKGDWRVVAFVIAQPGHTIEESEVIGHCRRRLAKSKVPVRVHQLDAFPTTPSANSTKIQKGKLREIAQTLVG
jgi:fatty-acyl-CoA synthase